MINGASAESIFTCTEQHRLKRHIYFAGTKKMHKGSGARKNMFADSIRKNKNRNTDDSAKMYALLGKEMQLSTKNEIQEDAERRVEQERQSRAQGRSGKENKQRKTISK